MEEREKKEKELQQELTSLRNEIKKLKKVNIREEIMMEVRNILLTDNVEQHRIKEVVDYFIYILERENK